MIIINCDRCGISDTYHSVTEITPVLALGVFNFLKIGKTVRCYCALCYAEKEVLIDDLQTQAEALIEADFQEHQKEVTVAPVLSIAKNPDDKTH